MEVVAELAVAVPIRMLLDVLLPQQLLSHPPFFQTPGILGKQGGKGLVLLTFILFFLFEQIQQFTVTQ